MTYRDHFRSCFEGIDPEDEYAVGLERVGASLQYPHGPRTRIWAALWPRRRRRMIRFFSIFMGTWILSGRHWAHYQKLAGKSGGESRTVQEVLELHAYDASGMADGPYTYGTLKAAPGTTEHLEEDSFAQELRKLVTGNWGSRPTTASTFGGLDSHVDSEACKQA